MIDLEQNYSCMDEHQPGGTHEKIVLDLDILFKPKGIVVIGASSTPGKMGTTSLFCIKAANFTGKIYPINPKETETQGIKTYDRITSVPQRVDLAIICVGAVTVPQVIEECA
ncbi:MAG: CoA-binding protein [Thermodesulfobacteriota bacterium]|nr:CoA-binding protein [Thermodesulfobacteriota bacterium]